MDEYLMPSPYTCAGAGLGVMLAGLSGPYQKLELSVDGQQFFEVRQDEGDPFYSTPHLFQNLTEGMTYRISGRVTTEQGTGETSCIMAAARPANTARLRSAPVYRGGGMSKPPQRPKAGYKDGDA